MDGAEDRREFLRLLPAARPIALRQPSSILKSSILNHKPYLPNPASLCPRPVSPQNRRCRGHSPEDAQDLTQEFFAHVLHKGYFHLADRTRGRFRTFLVHALEHFLINEWKRGHAPLAWALPRAFVGRGRSDGRSAGQRGAGGAWFAGDEPLEAEPAQIVGHLSGSVLVEVAPQQGRHVTSQPAVSKALRQCQKQAKRQE